MENYDDEDTIVYYEDRSLSKKFPTEQEAKDWLKETKAKLKAQGFDIQPPSHYLPEIECSYRESYVGWVAYLTASKTEKYPEDTK